MLSIQVHLMSGNFIKYIDLHIIPYYKINFPTNLRVHLRLLLFSGHAFNGKEKSIHPIYNIELVFRHSFPIENSGENEYLL